MKKKKFDLSLSKKKCFNYRKRILEISQKVSALHVGGSFSCTEIMDVLFNHIMRQEEKKLFIMSKGHASIIQYVILEDQKILTRHNIEHYSTSKGILGVHPDRGVNGINATTGSLGHGLAMAAGVALAQKKRVFIIISDGELQEGSTWEAIITIGALKLKNLIMIVDNNNLQSLEKMSNSHPNIYPIEKKLKSFGWNAKKCNGHNSKKIYEILTNNKMKQPLAIIAKTIKGFPVSKFSNPIWHYRSPNKKEFQLEIKELENAK